MRQRQLEHLIRAATTLLDSGEVIVIGSQSILASHKDTTLPAELTMSIEADFVPVSGKVSDSDLIDGAIGEGSMFHQTFGVYAEGVSPTTAVLAAGWEDRLIPLPDPESGAVGLCLDPHDLCASKLIAGRPKDLAFVQAAVAHHLVDPQLVEEHLGAIDHDIVAEQRELIVLLLKWITRRLSAAGRVSFRVWRRPRHRSVAGGG